MNRGSITLYFSVIILVIVSLLGTMIEGVRFQGMKANAYNRLYMAADAVFAEYGRQLYENYGMLSVWKSEEAITGEIAAYFMADINPQEKLSVFVFNLHQMELEDIRVDAERLTDGGGCYFASQAVEAVKTNSEKAVIDFLLKQVGLDDEAAMLADFIGKIEDFKDHLEKISNDLIGIQDMVLQMKEGISEPRETILEILETLKSEGISAGKALIEEAVKDLFEQDSELADTIYEIKKEIEDYRQDVQTAGAALEKKKEEILEAYSKAGSEMIDDEIRQILGTAEGEDPYGVKASEQHMDLLLQLFQMSADDFWDMLNSEDEEMQNQAVQWLEELSGQFSHMDSDDFSITYEKTEEEEASEGISTDFLTQIKELAEGGILSLVTGDADIPNGVISDSDLPSQDAGQWKEDGIVKSLEDRAWLCAYAMQYFGNYLDRKEDTAMTCELEYLVGGNVSERDNMTAAAAEILGIRESVNLIYLLTDTGKRQEAYNLALMIPGVNLQPILTVLVQMLILAVWALAESFLDVRDLFQGGKVPLWKNEETWKLSVMQLPNVVSQLVNPEKETGDTGKSEIGLDYRQYLAILLMSRDRQVLSYRMMDLIQVNMKKNVNNEFLMKDCVCSVQVDAVVNAQVLFIKMPGSMNSAYQIHAAIAYQY